MRRSCAALLVAIAATVAAAQTSVVDIRVISPGVVYNGGLLDLAAAFI